MLVILLGGGDKSNHPTTFSERKSAGETTRIDEEIEYDHAPVVRLENRRTRGDKAQSRIAR